MAEKNVRFMISIPRELHRRFKSKAVLEGRGMQEIIQELLQKYITQQEPEGEAMSSETLNHLASLVADRLRAKASEAPPEEPEEPPARMPKRKEKVKI